MSHYIESQQFKNIMDHRQNKLPKRKMRKSPSPKKNHCGKCIFKFLSARHINHSLYRKYSQSQNHYFLQKFNNLQTEKSLLESTNASIEEEYLSRYHKINSRKIILTKIKDIYKVHQEIPRIHDKIEKVLLKSYHRKRLLQYFKIAKSMGLQIDSINYSSFMLSLHLNPQIMRNSFEKVLMEDSQDGAILTRHLLSQLRAIK